MQFQKRFIVAIIIFFSIPIQNNAPLTNKIFVVEHNKELQALLNAYPDYLLKAEDNFIYWKDGSKMLYDDGKVNKDFEELLNNPDLQDQMFMKYPGGEIINYNPPENFDSGRIRYETFFCKMYGNTKEKVMKNLVGISWMPKTVNTPILVTKINRVDLKLQQISKELDELPDNLKKYVKDIAETFVWKNIEGTERLSMHSFGIAIGISQRYSDYWRWNKPDKNGRYVYKNKIPFEVVSIFEKHGFIWGGRWYHFDIMYFEYRPELLKKF